MAPRITACPCVRSSVPRDSRIVLVDKENSGVSGHLQSGLEVAEGDMSPLRGQR